MQIKKPLEYILISSGFDVLNYTIKASF
jgi:hypothetical protein